VRLKINFTPIGNYSQRAAQFLSEVEANATPSFDLYQSSDTSSAALRRANAVEPVRWAALLPAGTPPEAVVGDGEHLIVYTDHTGLMTDPAVVSDAEVPRSLRDLANPRWRDKVILFSATSNYLPWVIRLGRDETLAAVRAAVQNGAIADTFPGMLTRYAAKEYPLVTIGVTFHHLAQTRGIAARFTPLDFSYNTDHHVSVARRAVHPNAAKLLAAVLAGPEGQRIEGEHIGVGSRYYADSREAHLEQEALAAGFASFTWVDNPDGLAFALSPEGEALMRELDQVLKGG
jgi:ABC-type Fe3+ transport system substrate-binding protein